MSIELFFPGSRSQRWLRIGPLVRDLDGFAAWLAAQGYTRRSARTKLRLVRHLSLWLESAERGAEALDEERFETFLLTRGPRYVRNGEAGTDRQLLTCLRHEGRIPEAPEDTDSTEAITPIERTYEPLLEEYLATRRALGVRLKDAGRLCEQFVAFAGRHQAPFVTTELALQWATESNRAQPAHWAQRLGLVRGFARYANAVDPRRQIPPQGLIAHRYHVRGPTSTATGRSPLRVLGEGRKERCTPLAKLTRAALKAWLREPPRGVHNLLFPSVRGERLTVHGVQYLLNRHCVAASRKCPSLKQQRVTVHRLRHTAAMDLLQAGVDRAVIALWLGHESVETTQIYLEATLAMKEQALAKTTPPTGKPARYEPGDRLLAFLSSL